MNFMYYIAIRSMEKLAGEFGFTADRDIFAGKAVLLGKTLSSFWDEKRGAFPDSLAQGSSVISEDTNALALLADFVTPLQN
jgi:hypothetical protein